MDSVEWKRVAQYAHRRVVLVSGPPASGKTTLARPLAEVLGFALLSKDDIKESLYTSLEGAVLKGSADPLLPCDVEVSRRLSDAAIDLLWTLAPQCPQVVLEANFRTQDPQQRGKYAALLAHPGTSCVEVHCRIPLEEAARRFAERARAERHHPAHPLQQMGVDRLTKYAEPFAMSAVIEVDMLRPIEIADLAELVCAIQNVQRTSGTAADV
jgi:predicted kinase